MSLKRVALIIGASGERYSDDYLAGVSRDLNNYREFLTSPEGGGWELDKDLFILPDARKSDILHHIEVLTRKDPSYSFVAFSGHGESDSKMEDFIWTQDNERLNSNSLWIKAKRKTLILDSCRVRVNEVIHESAEITAGMESFSDRTERLEYARRLFMEAIQKSQIPYVKINSCSYTESAGDNNRGGIFTFTFLDTIRDWALNANAVLSLQSAFNFTQKLVAQRTGHKQNPDIEKPRMHGDTPPIGVGMHGFSSN